MKASITLWAEGSGKSYSLKNLFNFLELGISQIPMITESFFTYNTYLIFHRTIAPQDTHWETFQGNYRENEILMSYKSRSGETK